MTKELKKLIQTVLLNLFTITLMCVSQIMVLKLGWGLTPQNWWWILGAPAVTAFVGALVSIVNKD